MQNPIRIALADDNLLMRKGLIMIIKEFPNTQVVTEAGNGKELLNHLTSLEQPPDICIIDVKMPVLNGFETLLELKRQWKGVKTLALSVYDNELSIIKFLRNGADGYIVKRCEPQELCNAIMHIYNGGIYYPEELFNKIPKNVQNVVDVIPGLTSKEYTFLSYCSTEFTYKEIAEKMNQSLRTIEGYRDQLLKKLNLRSRIGLAVFAIEAGITAISKIA